MRLNDYIRTTPDGTLADYNALPPVYRRVPVQEVRDLLIERRLNSRLKFARDNAAVPIDLRGGIIELFATLEGFEAVNATVEANHTQLINVANGLAVAGIVTTSDAAAFIALLAEPTDAPASQEQWDAAKAEIDADNRKTKWRAAKQSADAKASALIDADPLNATVEAVAAAYAAELSIQMEAGE